MWGRWTYRTLRMFCGKLLYTLFKLLGVCMNVGSWRHYNFSEYFNRLYYHRRCAVRISAKTANVMSRPGIRTLFSGPAATFPNSKLILLVQRPLLWFGGDPFWLGAEFFWANGDFVWLGGDLFWANGEFFLLGAEFFSTLSFSGPTATLYGLVATLSGPTENFSSPPTYSAPTLTFYG